MSDEPLTGNDIDRLMDLDPLSLSKQNLDSIIAYHRQARANFESGVKPKKEAGPTVKIDLLSLGLKKPSEPVKRRV